VATLMKYDVVEFYKCFDNNFVAQSELSTWQPKYINLNSYA